jgi:uncharacterized protein YdeI (BOF family)
MSLSKKIKIAVGIIALVLISAYAVKSVIYKPHTLIEQQESVYKGNALEFLESIKVDASQWQDKIVELSGNITSKDDQGIMLNGTIYCQMNVIEDLTELNIKQEVSIKGRIIGYDDLLEELKLDKTIITNTKK